MLGTHEDGASLASEDKDVVSFLCTLECEEQFKDMHVIKISCLDQI